MLKTFSSGDFSLKDDQHSDQPSEVDDDIMKAIIESNRHITVREITKQLNTHTTIENHKRRLGLVKFDIWVWQELKEIHLTQRNNICCISNVIQSIFF